MSGNAKDVGDLKTTLGGILCLLMRSSGPESKDGRGNEASVASGQRSSSHRGDDAGGEIRVLSQHSLRQLHC